MLVKVSKHNQENVLKVFKVKVLAAVKCSLYLLYYCIFSH